MSSQYPNEGSFPPPGNALQQFSDGFEDLSEINVNDLLEDDDFRINSSRQEWMGNQDSGSVQQPLMTNPSLEFGSNSFPVLNSLPGYHPMPSQTSPTAFGESSSCPNNFPPQNALPGQLLSDQPSDNNHGYVGSSYFSDTFSAQNPLSGQHHPLPNQPSNATVDSSFSVQNFPGHHPLPGQSSAPNEGTSHCTDSFSAQNSLSGQHPLPDQSSAPNVGNSYCPDSFSAQNSLSGQHPLPNQPPVANVGSSYCPDSFSAQNSLPRPLSLPNQLSTANAESSYSPDSFSAQNSLPRQLSLPNQLSTANSGSSFSVQNSVPRGYHSLPNQSSTANVGNSHCPNIISVQNSLRGQLPRPNQPLTANSFSQLNSLPAQILPNLQSLIANLRSFVPSGFLGQILPGIVQCHNAHVRRYSSNRLSAVQNTLPGQNLSNQTSTSNIRNSGTNNFSAVHNSLPGQNLPNQTSPANISSSVANNFSEVQNLPNQTSTENIRSSGANNFSAVQNLSNQTSTANIRSSGASNFSTGQNLPNQTSTPNIRSSGPNNVSAAQNLSPEQGRGRGRGRGRARGRPQGNRNSRGRGRSSSTGENNFQLLNFSPALNHPLSNRTTLMANIRSSNQNNVSSENILRIQQQQPPNSGANTGNSSNLNHHHAGNILQSSVNPYNFPVAAGDPGPVSSQVSNGNNIHPNNPLVGSNNFPVPGQDELPGGQITGAGNNIIQDDLASNFNPSPQELVVVPPAADNNQTSVDTGNNVEHTLDSVAANSSNNLAITEQPTAGDQNNNALQENAPVQIGEGGNHDNNNNNNNNNNSGVDHEGPELPPVEEINSAGKPGKSKEKDPPLAEGLSWLYSVKKPVKKRGDLDENCTDCFKRFCKSTENSFFRFKKYPGETSDAEKYPTAGETNGSEKISGGLTSGAPDNGKAGETNGSEKTFGGLNSGAPDNGRVPIDEGTTDGSTISPLPPPPELVVNSTVNAEAEPVVNTVTTEIAVLPLVSSSAVVENNVNGYSIASPAEMMEVETNYLTADAVSKPDQKWSEEFDMMIGM